MKCDAALQAQLAQERAKNTDLLTALCSAEREVIELRDAKTALEKEYVELARTKNVAVNKWVGRLKDAEATGAALQLRCARLTDVVYVTSLALSGVQVSESLTPIDEEATMHALALCDAALAPDAGAGHNPAHEIGTCGKCGQEMAYNVQRLGRNGGFIHKATGKFECFDADSAQPEVVQLASGALGGTIFKAGNRHIVVGPNRMCLCGSYHGETIHCDRLIKAVEKVRAEGLYTYDAFWLATALLHLIQDAGSAAEHTTSDGHLRCPNPAEGGAKP